MAFAKAERMIYKARKSTPGGGLEAGQLMEVTNFTPESLKDFETNHPNKPVRHPGPIDYPDELFIVDLTPAMSFQAPPTLDLDITAVKRLLHLETDEQVTVCVNHLGMPKGQNRYLTAGLIGPVVNIERRWKSNGQNLDFDQWLAAVRHAFPKQFAADKRRTTT